ncbi:hypothetical protein TFLX_04283 [Thermoflexales bacterium]|nr:hypothetical protein TFLX_04283 [Thermoflexales bacterium]
MNNSLWFNKEQLFWLEELDSDCFVEVQVQPWGEGVFVNDPSMARQPIALRDLAAFKDLHSDKNIWRSWTIYRDVELTRDIGPIPLILDIDDESEPPNLTKAYDLTRACLDIIESETKLIKHAEQPRVIFSGRKGFHIEIKPSLPIDAQAIRRLLLEALRKHISQANLNVFYESTVLDTLSHMWVRLTGTLYSWHSSNGTLHSRRVIPLRVEEFRAMQTEDIWALLQTG